jgi:hypothetical protein
MLRGETPVIDRARAKYLFQRRPAAPGTRFQRQFRA